MKPSKRSRDFDEKDLSPKSTQGKVAATPALRQTRSMPAEIQLRDQNSKVSSNNSSSSIANQKQLSLASLGFQKTQSPSLRDIPRSMSMEMLEHLLTVNSEDWNDHVRLRSDFFL
jgi:hypothetical protein